MAKKQICKIKNISIKSLSLFIVFLLFSNIANAINSDSIDTLDESNIIEDFTWSVLKYDHVSDTRNYGSAYTPRPMAGALVVLSNMMLKRVCRDAISLYDEDRMVLLENLRDFCIKNMKIFLFELYVAMISCSATYHSSCKSTADEMILLGDRLLKDYYSGYCYSQACFNTAILRLCGVPAEEVFNIIILDHAFTVVKIEDKWYAFDSAKGQFNEKKKYIYDKVDTKENYFSTLENDKYFINFETYEPEVNPSQQKNYSNMESSLLIDVINGIRVLMNNSKLGSTDCNLSDFISNSITYPSWKDVSVPYTVCDSCGDTDDEKASYLADIIHTFIEDQSGGTSPNQYGRCLYSMGLFPGKYPQAYANAAKYGVISSNYATLLDSRNPRKDIIRAYLWVNFRIKTKKLSEENHVYNSELICRIKKGSTIDKALVCYGTLRNMKKGEDFWSPDNLFIIVTDDYEGYLAVNHTSKGWIYLNFGKGFCVQQTVKNISYAFNEEIKLDGWNN